jgi:hypothetical protein
MATSKVSFRPATAQGSSCCGTAALAKGHLSFVVHGEKLKGHWDLIRTGIAGERGWLLVKQHDAWAATTDPTVERPESVSSGRDFAEVLAAQRSDPWPDQPPVRGGETGRLLREIMARAKVLRTRPKGRQAARSHQRRSTGTTANHKM